LDFFTTLHLKVQIFKILIVLVQLNLPFFSIKLEKRAEKIYVFDGLRKKYLLLTPEEWVRQHFVNFLIHNLKFPTSLISCENGLKYGNKNKRVDIIVKSPNGKVLVIIECKAPHIPISEKTLSQIAVYNQKLQPNFLVLTNGIHHFYLKNDGNRFDFIEQLPLYKDIFIE
jgi:Type I restriction enzyme R protein N terminus (HSDR_N)